MGQMHIETFKIPTLNAEQEEALLKILFRKMNPEDTLEQTEERLKAFSINQLGEQELKQLLDRKVENEK